MRSKFFTLAITLLVSLVVTVPVVFAQQGNTIEGFVNGPDRRPVPDLYVELYDDLGRSVARTRTSNIGAFAFYRLPQGNYVVRVLTAGTDYDEREERVEIYNIVPSATDNKQLLLYLKLKRGVVPSNAVAVFAQDVPDDAKKLYDDAVNDLSNRRLPEGLAGLRSAIEKFPKYYAALDRLGLEYLQMNKPETLQAAEIMLNLAVGVNPRGFSSWYGLALARYSLRNFTEAIPAVEKAIELRPTSGDAVFLYGRLLRATKKYAEAEQQLLKAKELPVEAPTQVHWELALLFGNNLKKYAEAAKELKLYLKAKPDAPNAADVRKLIADFEAKAAKDKQ